MHASPGVQPDPYYSKRYYLNIIREGLIKIYEFPEDDPHDNKELMEALDYFNDNLAREFKRQLPTRHLLNMKAIYIRMRKNHS